MTIPLHDPNENDLVCQGQFLSENLRISGDGIERIPLSNLSQSIEKRSKITVARKYLPPLFRCFPAPSHGRAAHVHVAGIVWHARQIAKLIDLGKSDTKILFQVPPRAGFA